MGTRLIFVYGTLKEGFGNHAWYLKGKSKKIGSCKTSPHHSMISLGGFPGVIYGEGHTAIKGEVYEIDEETSAAIDGLEGYPTFYNKTKVYTNWGLADMYILSKKFLSRLHETDRKTIDSGEWTHE